LVQEDGGTLRTVWTYRRDPYPSTQAILQMAGPRGHIACRDDAHSDTATADPRPHALVVRRTVQASAFRVHRIRYRPLSHSWPKRVDLESDQISKT
jgi:hypothetical protein